MYEYKCALGNSSLSACNFPLLLCSSLQGPIAVCYVFITKTRDMTCVEWVLQVANVCTLKDQFLGFFAGHSEMVCMSPSVHDISLPSARKTHSHTAHCLLVWSQQCAACRRTCTRIHRSTVCHCSTHHSLRHTVHIYSFTTMTHFVWGKNKKKKKSLSLLTPLASSSSAPGLDCSM